MHAYVPNDIVAGLRSSGLGDDVLGYVEGYDVPGESLGGIDFYVPRYLGGIADLELMGRMPDLRVCQILMMGYEHVLPHLPEGVTLCNAVGVHDTSTAELAVALTLASLRGLDADARAMASGSWLHNERRALADRRVVIIGYGGIGKAIARRLEPFEVHIDAVASRARVDGGRKVIALPDVFDVIPHADVVILAVPLTHATKGLVDGEFLSAMKDGALLVNVARGGVVLTNDLIAHLRDGRISAALDVTDPEPLPSDHVLWTLPNVLISPHTGGDTTAFLPRAQRLVAAQLQRWASGEPLHHQVTR